MSDIHDPADDSFRVNDENTNPNTWNDEPPLENGDDSVAQQTDPKKEKAEQKRLEKERKAAEKREKDAAKKRQKEEEKERKAALKQEKNTAKKQQQQGLEQQPKQKPPSGARKSFSDRLGWNRKREGVRPTSSCVCRVLLLDGTDYEINIDKHARGQELVDKVCEYVNVLEKDYFSCAYRDREDIKFWLDHEEKIIKQRSGKPPWTFTFEVKFYPPEPSTLQEDITRYQLCLQIRHDILSGKLPCSFVTHALLGSYTVQSEFGDYDAGEHGAGVDYIRDIQFANEQTDDLLLKIAELHRTHRGQTPAEAELHFLENAKKLALYGVELNPAKDYEGIDILIGASAGGVSIHRDRLRVNCFVWPKILKISYTKNTFYLKIRPAEFERYESTIGFKLPNHKMTKRLWRVITEHHTFFRLKEPLALPKGTLSGLFSSKHRYSGRTYYQSKMASQRINREGPQFDRSASRRLTGSRSMDSYGFDRSLNYEKNSASLDMRARPRGYGYDDSMDAGAEGEISVLAGTGPDASRLAYVKTVKPGVAHETYDPAPVRVERYANIEQEPPQRYDLPPGVDDSFNEPLPPPPASHKPEVKAKPKVKKKTKKTTVKQSGPEATMVTEYTTERDGVIEKRTERRTVVTTEETDIDHELALADAIHSVTDMDRNLAVEQIEISTKAK